MMKKIKKRARRSIRANKEIIFSYKRPEILMRYMTEQGEILPRIESNLTAKQQRQLSTAVKRSRILALTPFTQVL
jgi:small subunit ribosomal protein S18